MYIFFDTETTGVNKSSDRVVQLAWLISTESGKELSRKNFLIKPSGFIIPSAAEKIHGISTDVASRFGVSLRKALLDFSHDVNKCNVVVAHNISFDLGMLRPEFDRENIKWRLDEKLMICTMRASTNWCRLAKLDGRPGYKWPKLDELHYRLFGTYFSNAHDALNDVVATKDCFFELKRRRVIDTPSQSASETEAQKSARKSIDLTPRSTSIPQPAASKKKESATKTNNRAIETEAQRSVRKAIGLNSRSKSTPQPAMSKKKEAATRTKNKEASINESKSNRSILQKRTQHTQPESGTSRKNKPFRTVQSASLNCEACGETFSVTLRRYELSTICPNCFTAVFSEVQW